jgi:uncharacterized protein YciI
MSVNPDAIRLETYELVLLRHTRQYGDFGEEERERIFREHLGHTLSTVASGQQLAAGPVTDSPAGETPICGFGLFRQGSLDAVRRLMDADPGVRQGLYCFDVMTWRTPAGSVTFPSASAPA